VAFAPKNTSNHKLMKTAGSSVSSSRAVSSRASRHRRATENTPAKKSSATASPSTSKAGKTKASKTTSVSRSKTVSPAPTHHRLARAVGNDLLVTQNVGQHVKSLSKNPLVKAKTSTTKSDRVAKVSKTAKAVKAAAVKPTLKSTLKKTASKPAKQVKARASGKPVKASRRATVRAETPMNLAADIMAEAMMHAELTNEDAIVERAAAREERMRDILSRLAVSSNRFDEMPNLELAAEIVFNEDRDAVSLLITVLERGDDVHGPDAGRVLAEVGIRAQELLVSEVSRLVSLISEENIVVLPAVLTALSPLGDRVVDDLWDLRDLFWQIVNEGQTEADAAQAAAVKLLACMCAAGPDFARTLAGGLVDLLGKCLAKDVALYAEAVLPALGTAHSHRAKPVLDRRMKELSPAEVARLRRAVRMAQQGGLYSAAA
jgi:hypothetical protein